MSSFCFLVFLLCISPAFGVLSSVGDRNAMRLELTKRKFEGLHELVHQDNHRTRMISQRVGQRRNTLETSAAVIDISSGAYAGTGQYFVQMKIGSPSQKFRLVADTGSDLTWMNCRYKCRNCSKRINHRTIFHADRSHSFRPIPCSTQMCQNLPFSLAQCPSPMTPCQYDYRYSDGSTSHGIFANETVTVRLTNGRKMKLQHVVVGCSNFLNGSSFQASDGVLGLGYTNYSLVGKFIQRFGGKFSYCLVDHLSSKNITSYLTLGSSRSTNFVTNTQMRYTDLVLDVIDVFYPVNVFGMSINGVMLDIPIATWDVSGEGGVIIDSGTSLTFLAQPAYEVVMPALKQALTGFTKQVQMKPFEYCFSSMGFNEALIPKLVFHFVDSVQFEPPVKSYVIDVSPEVKCVGLMPNGWPEVSIIGNIMQQNFLWEFDIVNRRLGFAPSTCVIS